MPPAVVSATVAPERDVSGRAEAIGSAVAAPPAPAAALAPVEEPRAGSASETPDGTRTASFVDLFAGLGGFHVALSKLGGDCVFAAEWETDLQDLYETNFGMRPAGDITKVKPQDVPAHTVLCAGFPCQPFSKAGEQLGFEHTEQGRLFFEVLAILKRHRPTCFILENVPNLLNHDKGRTFQHIERSLRDLGYDVRHRRLSPHQFSIPQVRERVYIIGSLLPLDDSVWPAVVEKPTTIMSVLGAGTGKPLPPRVLSALEVWDEFLRAVPPDVELPSFPIWSMEFGATYPYEEVTPYELVRTGRLSELRDTFGSFGASLRTLSEEAIFDALPSHARRQDAEFPRWKRTFIRQNRDFYSANREWIDPWVEKVKAFPSSFQKFEWNAHGEERDIWKYVIQMRASGVRVKRATTAPSLIAMTDTQVPIIAWEKRYMTPEECAALQSLGSIAMPSSPTRAFRALGNAVNARVVELIARRLLPASGIAISGSSGGRADA